jgi:hypothetical protein
MAKPKTNWQARCLAAEKCAELLRIERDGAISMRSELGDHLIVANTKLRDRPTLEKIVEKEVLSKEAIGFIVLLLIGWVYTGCWMALQVNKLQTPIEKPEAVYVYKEAKISPFGLDECKQAWREDEAKIKKLRRR